MELADRVCRNTGPNKIKQNSRKEVLFKGWKIMRKKRQHDQE